MYFSETGMAVIIYNNEERGVQTSLFLHFSPPCLQKITIQIVRKKIENFVIFSEIILDILINGWYYIQARVGKLRVHCDDAGDCV